MYGHAAPPPPNLPAPPPPSNRRHHRYSSSSHTFSSASVVTVKRSSSGTRGIPMASQSPGDWNIQGTDASLEASHDRRKSVAGNSSEHGAGPSASGMGSVNRWSLSSGSSVPSPGNPNRSRASSSAVTPNLVDHRSSPRDRTSTSREPLSISNTTSPGQTQLLSNANAQAERRPAHKEGVTALPPLHATPGLTHSNDESPSTVQTITTPPISGLPSTEYFGLNNSKVSSRNKPALARNHTTPIASPPWSQQSHAEMPPVAVVRAKTAERLDHVRPSDPHDAYNNRRPKTREGQEKDKKAMLSKALQKANTAVLLDNAQNFEGALQAYSDACHLLQHVMERSTAAEDKRKLEAIRVTYTNRIDELKQLEVEQDTSSDDKSLPDRPMSNDSYDPNNTHLAHPGLEERRSSFFTETMHAVKNSMGSLEDTSAGAPQPKEEPVVPTAASIKSPSIAQPNMLQPPKPNAHFMPAPLSPRKSPASDQGNETPHWDPLPAATAPAAQIHKSHSASQMRSNSTSWLHTEEESPPTSSASSVHSVSSQTGLRRKHIRGTSGGTDPDFDAAFDAAVEAAYDEGFEPDLEMRRKRATVDRQATATATSAGFSALNIDRQPRAPFSGDLEDEEEERILAELTSDLSFSQNFNFDAGSKSALPRQSDSSGYSRSTWQSSQASVDRATATTSLSTVAEDRTLPRLSEKTSDAHLSGNSFRRDSSHFPASAPPPTTSLPPLPKGLPTPSARQSTVRSRRLSGHNAKNLKIETSTETRKRASTMHNSPSPRHLDLEKAAFEEAYKPASVPEPAISEPSHDQNIRLPPAHSVRANSTDIDRLQITTTLYETVETPEDGSASSISSRPLLFRKNKSSMSLRAEHTLLLSPTNDSAPSLMTPLSATFMSTPASRANDLRDSQRAKFSSIDAGLHSPPSHAGAADIFLFDTTLSSTTPASPRSPGQTPQPAALEPCPESVLLRPFWLMRALASTITHPYGGFLTSRLFVSREVWQTKGVKLKAIEDKIAQCDFLTAALGRLNGVDSYDADAIMDELQGFEEVMERVQAALSKKLGHDVGVQGAAGMFKDAAMNPTSSSGGYGSIDADVTAGAEKTKSKEGKGYLTSWRKLRNKSSNAQLSTAASRKTSDHKDQPTMPTVPMTAFVPVERRGHKREARNMTFEGPNREYMSSLARLLEGAQVLDHIARQVEDPGLKHSSPTHVGLELSVRHAAEFFGFFVCRFVLADLGILLEKFIKRGTEWVLA